MSKRKMDSDSEYILVNTKFRSKKIKENIIKKIEAGQNFDAADTMEVSGIENAELKISSIKSAQVIFDKFRFNENNINSILEKRRVNDKTKISLAIALQQHEEGLKFLIDVIKFKPLNLSSILCGAKAKAGSAIKTLADSKDCLMKLLEGGFKPSSISNILRSSGVKMVEALKVLEDSADDLVYLVKAGFKPEKIADTVNRLKINNMQAIKTLAKNKDELEKLIEKGLKPNYILNF